MNLPNPFPGHVARTFSPVVQSEQQAETFIKAKRAGTNGTLITIVLDESGSMNSCWDTTIVGFNEFVLGQKTTSAEAGNAAITLIKFDGVNSKTVFDSIPVLESPELNKELYRPSGGTNLLDAIGDAITKVNAQLSSMKKKDRPGVIITIMTDGGENSSRKYNSQQIKDMVAAAEKADWSFVFLGANIDTFAVGSTFGMRAANSVSYSTANMTQTMASASASTARMRTAKVAGVSTEEIYSRGLYTSDELKSMK